MAGQIVCGKVIGVGVLIENISNMKRGLRCLLLLLQKLLLQPHVILHLLLLLLQTRRGGGHQSVLRCLHEVPGCWHLLWLDTIAAVCLHAASIHRPRLRTGHRRRRSDDFGDCVLNVVMLLLIHDLLLLLLLVLQILGHLSSHRRRLLTQGVTSSSI